MTKAQSPAKSRQASKKDQIIKLLKRKNGASLDELGKATDWQEHSIRGFISGTLKKRLKFNISSDNEANGVRRYRIEGTGASTSVEPNENTG